MRYSTRRFGSTEDGFDSLLDLRTLRLVDAACVYLEAAAS